MKKQLKKLSLLTLFLTGFFVASAGLSSSSSAQVSNFAAVENPKANSYGLHGKIGAPPPTQGARILAPSGGKSYSDPLITVSGICPRGLLVEILAHNVMVGSAFCHKVSFYI